MPNRALWRKKKNTRTIHESETNSKPYWHTHTYKIFFYIRFQDNLPPPKKRMPTIVEFTDCYGRVRSFRAKSKKRSPAKTLAELNKRLRKLKSPRMREIARMKWTAAKMA